MAQARWARYPPPIDASTEVTVRPPTAQCWAANPLQPGWPPYCPGFFGPWSTPKRKYSAILDLRDKRLGKVREVGNARWGEGATPIPYHTLYFDPATEGDWIFFERYMPPGQLARRKWSESKGEKRFPEQAIASPNHENRKNYRGYHSLTKYTPVRTVVGDKNAPWNKRGDYVYTSWATVLKECDF